jgi:MFS family permease
MVTMLGAAGCLVALVFGGSFIALVVTAFLMGGTSNPLYSLLIAHTNDFLAHEDMASASGGLIVLNGIGAVGTPILVGYLMQEFGPAIFLIFMSFVMAAIAAYAVYRMTVRPARTVEETSPIAPYSMVSGTPVAAGFAQESAVERTSATAKTE